MVREYGLYQIPVLGINVGRVGALASAKTSNYKELINKYLLGDYYITKNLTLEAKIDYQEKNETESFVVYNDIVVHRGAFLQMLPLELAIDNTKFDEIINLLRFHELDKISLSSLFFFHKV